MRSKARKSPLKQHNTSFKSNTIQRGNTGKKQYKEEAQFSQAFRQKYKKNKPEPQDDRPNQNSNSNIEIHPENDAYHQPGDPKHQSFASQSYVGKIIFTNSKLIEAIEEGDKKQQPLRERIKRIIKKKINSLFNIPECEICEEAMNKDYILMAIYECKHKLNYCETCLHQYIIYKVKQFQEISCQKDDCGAFFDTNTLYFKQLDVKIRKKYQYIHRYKQVSKDPNRKLCPKQKCEGIISIVTDKIMVCDICESLFCGKCLLAMHEGQCERQEIEFLQKNLHYRQCQQCRFIVEKTIGCNHIKCRCGYQFCYICGEQWTLDHKGAHDQNGHLIRRTVIVRVADIPLPPVLEQVPQPVPVPVLVPKQVPIIMPVSMPAPATCCNRGILDRSIFLSKAALKLVLLILWTVLMSSFMIMAICFSIPLTIAIGLFGYSFLLLMQLELIYRIFGAILFPFLMLVGIVMVFVKIWKSPNLWTDKCRCLWQCFMQVYRKIYSI